MQLIRKHMEDHPPLTLWHGSDFLDLGRSENVKVILSRLCQEGFVKRAIDGFYYLPKSLGDLGVAVPPSPNDLALKIASVHRWSIVPRGETALNALGLSTQVPFVYEFSSDGPYRTYEALGVTIRFYHISSRFIKGMSPKTALFVEALKALGRERLNDSDIRALASQLSQNQIDKILAEAKTAPAWVYGVALRLKEQRQ